MLTAQSDDHVAVLNGQRGLKETICEARVELVLHWWFRVNIWAQVINGPAKMPPLGCCGNLA